MLKSVEFNGQFIRLGRLTVIVGQNGVGKSALLQAIKHGQKENTGGLFKLIDNFSDGLHMSAQAIKMKELQAWLNDNPTAQAAVVTYSPFQLETVDKDDVIVIAKRGDTVKVKRLSEHPKLDKWRSSFGTDELWANLGEDWVFDETD